MLAIFILTNSLKIKSILWRHKCQLLRALKFFACWEKMATLLLNERKFTNTHRTTVHTAAYCCLMIEVYSLSTCWVQYWDQCWEKKQQKKFCSSWEFVYYNIFAKDHFFESALLYARNELNYLKNALSQTICNWRCFLPRKVTKYKKTQIQKCICGQWCIGFGCPSS